MVFENEINEIGEEHNIDEIESNLVNNVISKLKEFGKSSRRDTHFMRSLYIPARRIINFSFGFIPRKPIWNTS